MATAPVAPDPGAGLPAALETAFETWFAWNYAPEPADLHDLYEKAKRDQWNGSDALDWSQPVEPEGEIVADVFNPLADYAPYKALDARGVARFRHATISWQLSQFLHGEQGALITASQLVGAVPCIEAKHYAATQTMDEARHVEVFRRYLREKLEWEWPINENLKTLLDTILLDARWDFKYLGMQILVEGLAMAAFGNLHQMARDPLLKSLLHNVMRDEARHVAFGVLSLRDHYLDMPESERRDREDFIIEASLLMRDRLVGDDIAEAMGFDRDEVRGIILESTLMRQFRRLLFARVVPNVKKLGLLTPRVRKAFAEMEILAFEDLDPDAQDRALGLS